MLNLNIIDFARLNGFRQGTLTASRQLIKDPPAYEEVIEAIEDHLAKVSRATDPAGIAKLPPSSDLTSASKYAFYAGNATLLACQNLKKAFATGAE